MRSAAYVLLITCLFLSARAASADEKPVTEKPVNVLFLLTDDQRADTIAAVGNPQLHTPNLDRLAETGFVFDHAFCMGSTMGAVCNPSRHMLLSGRSLYRYDKKDRTDTFGEVMRRAGYETYHESKLGNTAREYHKAFEHSRYLEDKKVRSSGEHGQTISEHAIAFLKDRSDERPFFMYLGFAGPHDPRVASRRWMNLYARENLTLPANYLPFHPFDNGEMLVRDEKLAPWPRTEAVVKEHLHDYYACISSIDYQIGRILETLEQTGELENTLIVFSSDHGLAVGSHGLFGKQSLYDHSMKSPLIFWGPGVPQGRSEALAYLFDIFPTVCDYVGIPVPDRVEGKSLMPVIDGKTDKGRDELLLAYMECMRAIRTPEWKLIRYPKVDVTQLFHLSEDPQEQVDLAEQPEFASKVAELSERLQQLQKQYDDTLPWTADNLDPAKVDLEFFDQAR